MTLPTKPLHQKLRLLQVFKDQFPLLVKVRLFNVHVHVYYLYIYFSRSLFIVIFFLGDFELLPALVTLFHGNKSEKVLETEKEQEQEWEQLFSDYGR